MAGGSAGKLSGIEACSGFDKAFIHCNVNMSIGTVGLTDINEKVIIIEKVSLRSTLGNVEPDAKAEEFSIRPLNIDRLYGPANLSEQAFTTTAE